MKCLFENEVKAGTMCCDYGGECHEQGVEQCPTVIFNMCQSLGKDQEPVPETLDYCRKHYVPPVKKYISCECFGNSDGMSGGCWWCMEMTPYQWHMCQDEAHLRGLLNHLSKAQVKTKAEAIEFIEDYKKRCPMCNERMALPDEHNWENE